MSSERFYNNIRYGLKLKLIDIYYYQHLGNNIGIELFINDLYEAIFVNHEFTISRYKYIFNNKNTCKNNKNIIYINMCLIDKMLHNYKCNKDYYFYLLKPLILLEFIMNMPYRFNNCSNLDYLYKFIQLIHKIVNNAYEMNYKHICSIAPVYFSIKIIISIFNKLKIIPIKHKEIFNDIILILLNPRMLSRPIRFCDDIITKIEYLKKKTLTQTFIDKFADFNWHNTIEYQQFFNGKDISEYLFSNSNISFKKYYLS